MHHAYLLVGDKERARAHLTTLFGDLVGSPDFFPYTEEVFGVEQARKLSRQALHKAFGGKKIFFIAPESITLEAQNALLKTFEEPIADTHFFLVLRDAGMAIPTLLSRMEVVSLGAADDAALVTKFLKGSLKERFAFVKKFVDKEESLTAFLDALLLELRRSGESAALASAFKLRLVAHERAASPRLILEHLAAVL
jgi:DNA polymerase III delta prime subunit